MVSRNSEFAPKLCLQHFLEEGFGSNPERRCDLDYIQKGNVSLAAFDHANVIAVQTREFRQLLL